MSQVSHTTACIVFHFLLICKFHFSFSVDTPLPRSGLTRSCRHTWPLSRFVSSWLTKLLPHFVNTMAFKYSLLFVLMAMIATAYAETDDLTFTFDTVSALIAGTVGVMILLLGLVFCLYDYQFRNYAAEMPENYKTEAS
ncbi:uncharacterized protein [Ptychodera flava]|uniref:uncharacterized protein n=1 Tax=Ptychodera flava TaxID=63121 RepID=UPI003969F9D7